MHVNPKYNSPEWEEWQSEIVNPEEKNIGGKILRRRVVDEIDK